MVTINVTKRPWTVHVLLNGFGLGSQNINCCQLEKKLKCNTITHSLQPHKTVSKFMWVSEQSDSCYTFSFCYYNACLLQQ